MDQIPHFDSYDNLFFTFILFQEGDMHKNWN